LTRTFYEASATEEEDRRRCHTRGDSAEDGLARGGGDTEVSALDDVAVDVYFPLPPSCTRSVGLLQHRLSEERESAILKACAASSGEQGRPTGTSEERVRVLLSKREWPSKERERASGVGTRRQRRAITTRVSNVRKKATLGGNQRRRLLRNERIQLGHQQRRHILRNMCRQYESYQ
jgi:hypothetical protein